ncbi:membrane protein [Bacteroidia bacterium]|nr:membrane protein [Bacteroidia bacterium]
MKKLFIISIFAFAALNINADNTKATLKKATVYFSGAELTHTANINLVQGENEITLEGLTPNIDINSLKINVNNSVMVASSEFSNDYLMEKKSSNYVKKLQDSIDFSTADIQKLTTAIKINTASLDLLKKGVESNIGNTTAEERLTVDELTQNLDFYTARANTLEKSIAADTKQKTELTNTLNRLNQQIRQEQQKKGIYNGILKLSLAASYATSATVTVSYFTPNASWTPFYDMVITDVSKPVQLKGKSKVRQTTGIDWNKVNIVLSTATPSKTKDAPVFSTWFLDYIYYNRDLSSALSGYVAGVSIQNSISYDDVKEVSAGQPGAADRIMIRGVASIDKKFKKPLYIIDGIPQGTNPNFNMNDVKSMEVLKDASATSIYGSRAAGGVILITTKSMEDYVTAEEKNISIEYAIDLPYSIPGNGKEQIIDLKNYNLTADYKYYCAPKLDENVFLIADFKDWEKLNILSGMANIIYDGTYIGQTYFNTAQTNQVLSVTLGTDKRVSVKREKLTDFSAVKTLGSDLKVTLGYKITVKNNQSKPIKFTLKEQYPISTQKEIKAELLDKETTTPTVNKEDIGVLTWDFDLATGASREFKVGYSVRYPKDRQINLK